jgi:phospholipid/cholesterol/gamma-HCH transport system permease protein
MARSSFIIRLVITRAISRSRISMAEQNSGAGLVVGIGGWTVAAVRRTGAATIFMLRVLAASGVSRRRVHLTLREIYFAGTLSLVIIMVSGLFVGMVLGMQGYETLQTYGSEEKLGVLVALSLVRELGPVVAALLFASRAGSAITAEIGLMKATDQLAAMEMMAVDPVSRVVAPRFWGAVLSMPLLAALFSSLGILGAYLVGVSLLGVDEGAFWSQMQAAVDVRQDVLNGVVKSIVFGIGIATVATFEGFDAPPTAEGVSRATTRTVVHSSLLILALDLVLTGFMLQIWGH